MTRIVSIDPSKIGTFKFSGSSQSFLGDWNIELDPKSQQANNLVEAADHLRRTSVPVAFPTETVYGLGADATRSAAVLGIYKAKQRPADNPLIVHICSLAQLRSLLKHDLSSTDTNSSLGARENDPIPRIYRIPIQRFWPGPLTILLPVPPNSTLAPEVTAGLPTFGARMPSSELALALIKTADLPLAAPSANASTKPSPTTAQHVKHDLDGRIELILDGGPCHVGVESTVIDGLSDPPSILRPGGVSIDQLRECEGWEKVTVGYINKAQGNGNGKGEGTGPDEGPRAPGMKYKHYSPKAKVILVEAGMNLDDAAQTQIIQNATSIGIIRTSSWKPGQLFGTRAVNGMNGTHHNDRSNKRLSPPQSLIEAEPLSSSKAETQISAAAATAQHSQIQIQIQSPTSISKRIINIWDIGLGCKTADIARGLFSSLRELDLKNVDVIVVEGIRESESGGETGAAIMNRLRKAAEWEVKS